MSSRVEVRDNNVRLLREARMMTAKKLSVESGVSQSTISKVERGQANLSPDVADKLARALGTTASALASPIAPLNSPVFFRSMTAASKSARGAQSSRSEMADTLVTALDELLEFPTLDISPLDVRSVDEISNSVIEDAARRLRSAWSLGSGPIQNLVASAEAHGIVVCMCSFGVETLDAFSRMGSTGRPIAMINTDRGNAFRWRFDLAHEVGHMVLHRGIAGIDSVTSDVQKIMEAQSHRFAGALLLPEDTFPSSLLGLSLDDFRRAKPEWGVSIAAMVRRAYDLGLIDDSQYTSRSVGISKRHWRKSEPLDNERMPESPTLLRKCVSLCVSEGLFDLWEMMTSSGIPVDIFEDLVGVPRDFVKNGGFGTTSKVDIKPKSDNLRLV